jgi:hypothetical protein
MTTIVIEDHPKQTIEAFARGIFYFGALVSLFDGLLTWLVVRSAGVSLEQNWGMGWLMRHIGLGPTIFFRVAIGVFLFWYVSNLLVGRRIFFLAKRAAKYTRMMASTSKYRFVEWLKRNTPTIQALEAIFILVITSAVVGNNIQAAILWFNAHPMVHP